MRTHQPTSLTSPRGPMPAAGTASDTPVTVSVRCRKSHHPGLAPRWETELSDVEFAVQEVPDADTIGEDEPVPLARIVRASPDTSDPGHPATGPRIVLFRRPLLARAEDEDELSELIFDVVVEEVAEILGVDPEIIDPGYGELG